jgi:hypothetical protein
MVQTYALQRDDGPGTDFSEIYRGTKGRKLIKELDSGKTYSFRLAVEGEASAHGAHGAHGACIWPCMGRAAGGGAHAQRRALF